MMSKNLVLGLLAIVVATTSAFTSFKSVVTPYAKIRYVGSSTPVCQGMSGGCYESGFFPCKIYVNSQSYKAFGAGCVQTLYTNDPYQSITMTNPNIVQVYNEIIWE